MNDSLDQLPSSVKPTDIPTQTVAPMALIQPPSLPVTVLPIKPADIKSETDKLEKEVADGFTFRRRAGIALALVGVIVIAVAIGWAEY
jgi:hypothetical protein